MIEWIRKSEKILNPFHSVDESPINGWSINVNQKAIKFHGRLEYDLLFWMLTEPTAQSVKHLIFNQKLQIEID